MFKLYNNANSTNSKDFVLELKQNNEPKYQLNIKINSENKQLKDYYEKFSSHHIGDSGTACIEKAKLFLFATTALKNKTLFYFLTVLIFLILMK